MHTDRAATVDLLVHEARRALKPVPPPELAKPSRANQITSGCRLALLCLAIVSILLNGLSVTPASAQLREMALGVWAEGDGGAHIEIAPCGDKLCGRIVWLKQPVDENGRPLMDKNNPNPTLRTRPILGLLIMGGPATE